MKHPPCQKLSVKIIFVLWPSNSPWNARFTQKDLKNAGNLAENFSKIVRVTFAKLPICNLYSTPGYPLSRMHHPQVHSKRRRPAKSASEVLKEPETQAADAVNLKLSASGTLLA